MTAPDNDLNERDALQALVESDGWAVFLKYVQSEHGADACLRDIDAALAKLPRGDMDGVNDTVTQIRARAQAVQWAVQWPALRLQQLTPKKAAGGFFERRRA